MRGILFRYATSDLLKVFVVTAAVLVVVVAFGSLIKPLAANLLGPLSALRYALMAAVPVLEYAVPFATGFACTLATHRMAVDNEITAMSSAGIPMTRILVPQAAVGTLCGLGLFVLVNTAVPEVENLMREMLAREAGRVVLSQLRDGESVAAGNVVIHADAASDLAIPVASASPGELRPRERLLLEGVAAFETDAKGQPLTEFVAKRAVVDLYELPARGAQPPATALKLRLEDAVLVRPIDGSAASVPVVEPSAFVIGAVGARPTQFLTGDALVAALSEPGQTAQALEARRRLEMDVADAAAFLSASAQLAQGNPMVLVDPATSRTYTVSGAQLQGRVLRPVAGASQIRIEERDGETLLRTATMASASLDRARGEWLDLEGGMWVATDMVCQEPRATSAANGAPLRWPHRVEGLRVATEPLLGATDEQLRAAAAAAIDSKGPWSAQVDRLLAQWEQSSKTVQRHAGAYLHLRVHAAVLVPIVALLGAVAAVLLRRASPLAVYLVAFLPTLIAVILAAQGKELLRDGDPLAGLLVMWSGPAVMLTMALLGLRKATYP